MVTLNGLKWFVFRHHFCFHKIKAKSEREARLLLMVRKAYSSFYFKLVGEFSTKDEAKKFIKETRRDGYITDNSTLLKKG